jgi:hypothetical protein
VDTVVFHIDAMTGKDARKGSVDEELLQGHDIIAGPIVDAFLLERKTKTVVLLDEFMQVRVFFTSVVYPHSLLWIVNRCICILITKRTKRTLNSLRPPSISPPGRGSIRS